MDAVARKAWAARFERELTGNILPFWMRYTVDSEHSGFHGFVGTDLRVDPEAPRAAVINARILWTFSAAARLCGDAYRAMADRAFGYVTRELTDREYGGVYWMVDRRGRPLSDRKQIYAQAFAIYGLAEYFRATARPEALDSARSLFRLIEQHSRDMALGGYLEACSREWGALDDLRLSEKDLNSPKSMNTHLHIMEAYTNLLRVWRDPALAAAQKELLQVTMDRIVDDRTGHFRLFFDRGWNPMSDHVSFGHDIEGSWLLVEAAEVLDDIALVAHARRLAIRMAEAVSKEGLDRDGSLFYERDGHGTMVDPNKHWWAQAEAVVGFYNAYRLSGERRLLEASRRVWEYIEQRVVDRAHGEWHAKLKPDGTPYTAAEDPDVCLVGPWKCPYHNSRVCFEMMRRLQ